MNILPSDRQEIMTTLCAFPNKIKLYEAYESLGTYEIEYRELSI
jgi:hypothetical protein